MIAIFIVLVISAENYQKATANQIAEEDLVGFGVVASWRHEAKPDTIKQKSPDLYQGLLSFVSAVIPHLLLIVVVILFWGTTHDLIIGEILVLFKVCIECSGQFVGFRVKRLVVLPGFSRA